MMNKSTMTAAARAGVGRTLVRSRGDVGVVGGL
jgi:hypothetical protein